VAPEGGGVGLVVEEGVVVGGVVADMVVPPEPDVQAERMRPLTIRMVIARLTVTPVF
jgi:hypothetical protein